jgi:hypothetical protein
MRVSDLWSPVLLSVPTGSSFLPALERECWGVVILEPLRSLSALDAIEILMTPYHTKFDLSSRCYYVHISIHVLLSVV